MAIKDQCNKCKLYSSATDTCVKSNSAPLYNSSSCEDYKSQVSTINLEKVSVENTVQAQSLNANPVSNNANNQQQKQNSKRMFSAPFSFSGRIRRLEYGITYILYYIYAFIVGLLAEDDMSDGAAVFILLTFGLVIWIVVAQGAKRCHDRGNNGFFQLIPFYWLWMIFAEGDSGNNEYGESPK